MSIEQYIETCAKHIIETAPIDNVQTTNLVYDGVKIGWPYFKNDVILNSATLKEANCDMVEMFAKPEKSRFASSVCMLVRKHFTQVEQSKREEMRESMKSGEIPEDTLDPLAFIPVVDASTNSKILVHRETKEITDLSYDVWEDLLDAEELAIALEEKRVAKFMYDPYDISSLVLLKEYGFEVLKVNTYVPPAWRLHEIPEVVECPEPIGRFLAHLFPDPACKEFVLNWMHHALVSRNETFLVLNGSKGVGKGVFASLLKMLVGQENYLEAPVGLLTNQFNAGLEDRRVISLDEFKVGKKEHTKLKRYVNKMQTLEKKGKDADKEKETYNSYIISNNDVTDMFIEVDDRRFSVPDLTTTNLSEVMSIEEIEEFVNSIEHDENMAIQFGYWVYLHGKCSKYHPFSVWKGEKFFVLAYNSLREWQKFLVDKILLKTDSSIDIKRARKEYSKEASGFPRNIGKIADFFTNYKHMGVDTLGIVEQDEAGEWVVTVDKKYCPAFDHEPVPTSLDEDFSFDEEREEDLDDLL